MISWSKLTILEVGDEPTEVEGVERFEELNRYMHSGALAENRCFAFQGLPGEFEDDPKTWGPPSADRVDWTGFATALVRVRRFEAKSLLS